MMDSQKKAILINIPDETTRIVRDMNPDLIISSIPQMSFEYFQKTRICENYDMVIIGPDPRLYMPRIIRTSSNEKETLTWEEALSKTMPIDVQHDENSLPKNIFNCIINPLISRGRNTFIFPPAQEETGSLKEIQTMSMLSDAQLNSFGASVFKNIFSYNSTFMRKFKDAPNFPFLREKAQYFDHFGWQAIGSAAPILPELTGSPEYANIMDKDNVFPIAKYYADGDSSLILYRNTDDDENMLEKIDGFINYFANSPRTYYGFNKIKEYYDSNHEVSFPIIGSSETLKRFLHQLNLASFDSKGNVLLIGETGTGKELAAEVLHFMTFRKGKDNFVTVNCAILSDALSESILFGSVKGAYTGSIEDRPGLIADANKGSLFLDEIQAIYPFIRDKLLRFIQTGEYRRVGENRIRHANVRIIAATNSANFAGDRQLQQSGFLPRFGWILRIPSLRYRKEDIGELVEHFYNELAEKHPCNPEIMPPRESQIESWRNEDWRDSNIRGLQSAVGRYFFTRLAEVKSYEPAIIPSSGAGPKGSRLPDKELIEIIKSEDTLDSQALFNLIQKKYRAYYSKKHPGKTEPKIIHPSYAALRNRISERSMDKFDKVECRRILKDRFYNYPKGGENRRKP